MSSRLEKIGTIYSRAEGLLQRGVVRINDRPLWFDIYKAFPPMEVPSYSRPLPDVPLKPIFYKEDELRAKFHESGFGISGYRMDINGGLGGAGGVRKYLEMYKTLKAQNTDLSEEELVAQTAASISEKYEPKVEVIGDEKSISQQFLEALNKADSNRKDEH